MLIGKIVFAKHNLNEKAIKNISVILCKFYLIKYKYLKVLVYYNWNQKHLKVEKQHPNIEKQFLNIKIK